MSDSYSLMIHGGSGCLEDLKYEAGEDDFQQSIKAVLAKGRQRLADGARALDVVEYCVSLLENDPLYNAGRGSVLNAKGQVEMDAALMNGSDLRAGAVACVREVKNPIAVARQVLEHGQNVLLVGEGALEFANLCNLERCHEDYFITQARIEQLKEAKVAGRITLDHERVKPSEKLRSEEHTSELQSRPHTSYAVFCLKKKILNH